MLRSIQYVVGQLTPVEKIVEPICGLRPSKEATSKLLYNKEVLLPKQYRKMILGIIYSSISEGRGSNELFFNECLGFVEYLLLLVLSLVERTTTQPVC